MIRKSNQFRTRLLASLGHAVWAFQDATDKVDETAAGVLGLNRTDMRCLSVLTRVGTLSASELAAAAGLTRGAMTTALDRMEQRGYVRRVHDREDRRSIRIEVTALARRQIQVIYGPIAAQGSRLMQKYTSQELAAIMRFLEEGQSLQREHAKRIRQRAPSSEPSATSKGVQPGIGRSRGHPTHGLPDA